MSLLDTFDKIYKVEKKYGLLWTVPLFLIGCGTVFTCLYDQGLLPNLNEITKNCINLLSNSAQTGSLSLTEALGTISQPFFNVLPFMLIGAGTAGIPSWTVFGASDLVRDAWDTAKIEHDRKETILSNIPKQDRDKVNTKDREKYLSCNNELLRLYAGPDKKGRLIVPEGIESIGPNAFERFVTEKDLKIGPRIRNDIASIIVIPSSIRSLNPANIPRNSLLEFTDATRKICLESDCCDLHNRNISVQGGLFTDLLIACKVPDQVSSLNSQVSNLPTAVIDRLKNTLISIKDQKSKERILDELHKHVLCGDLTLMEFCAVLKKSGFENPKRYEGPDVIERLYGSEQNAIEQYANSYYQAENERAAEAAPKRKKNQRNNNETKAEKTIEEFIRKIEGKAKEPLVTESEQLKDVPDLKKRRVKPEAGPKAKSKNNKSKNQKQSNTHGRN